MHPNMSADQSPFGVAFTALLEAAGLKIDGVLRALPGDRRGQRSTLYDWKNGQHLPEDPGLLLEVVQLCLDAANKRGIAVIPDSTDGWLRLLARARGARASRTAQEAFARTNYVVRHFVEPKAPPIEELRKKAPSELLAARNAVVDFTGRREEQAALTEWRDDDTTGRCSVYLLWGQGGQGKTRLASEWAEDSARQGWDVLTAEHGVAGGADLRDPESAMRSRRRLLLVDYAERWPGTDLERLLMADPVTGGGPMRVLLLARAAGLWWEALQYRLGKSGYATCDMKLRSLADSVTGRQAIFSKAAAGFATVFGLPDTDGLTAVGSLADKAYRLVLAVHMAALVAVDARVGGRELPRESDALSKYLLRREQDHWELMKRSKRVQISPEDMGRVVTVATLTRPMSWTAAEDLLIRTGLCSSPKEGRWMLDNHASCYPPTEPATVLEPLLPDRLGEDFLGSQLPNLNSEAADAGQGDGWCAGLTGRLLAPNGLHASAEDDNGGQSRPSLHGAVPAYRRSAWTMLIETGYRWRHVAKGYLYPLLRQQPRLISEIGSAALTRLAEYAPPDVLNTLVEAFPEQRQVDLDAGIAAIAARHTQYRLDVVDNPAEQADLRLALANRWVLAGFYDRALNEAERAVQISRLLVQEHADETAEALLSFALMRLGSTLAQLERPVEAHAAAEEAVQGFRRLASMDPDAFDPDLSAALIGLSEAQLDLGRYQSARATAQEAVNVLRRLTRQNQDEWQVSLAAALIYLAMACARLGQSEEAKAAGEEAVEITRSLARSSVNLTTYKPNLAITLNNFGGVLSDLYLLEDAQACSAEAAWIFRELSRENPAAFEQELLKPLSNLCNWLSKLGRHEEALAYADEAISILQRLAQDNQAAAESSLAFALANRASSLNQLGQREHARADVEQAIGLYRRLVQENPEVFRPHFASALATFGEVLSGLWEIGGGKGRRRRSYRDLPAAQHRVPGQVRTRPRGCAPSPRRRAIGLVGYRRGACCGRGGTGCG